MPSGDIDDKDHGSVSHQSRQGPLLAGHPHLARCLEDQLADTMKQKRLKQSHLLHREAG